MSAALFAFADYAYPQSSIGETLSGPMRRPLGITIIGGLIFSQALTFYTTPVVYLYFDRLREWWESRRAEAIVPPQVVAGLPDAT
jgi:hypothetical protein